MLLRSGYSMVNMCNTKFVGSAIEDIDMDILVDCFLRDFSLSL